MFTYYSRWFGGNAQRLGYLLRKTAYTELAAMRFVCFMKAVEYEMSHSLQAFCPRALNDYGHLRDNERVLVLLLLQNESRYSETCGFAHHQLLCGGSSVSHFGCCISGWNWLDNALLSRLLLYKLCKAVTFLVPKSHASNYKRGCGGKKLSRAGHPRFTPHYVNKLVAIIWANN